MMKKQITTLFLAVVLTFSLAAVGFAEEKQAETPVDPNATNLTAVYPLLEEAVPAVPVKPESLKDAKAVTEYIAAVDNYLKAVQRSILTVLLMISTRSSASGTRRSQALIK